MWPIVSHNNNDVVVPPIIGPNIFIPHSHHLGKYKLTVVSISYDGPYEHWVDINKVTYLITDYIPNPGAFGNPEPAKTILNDKDNESNLASGRVSEIKDNLDGYVTFYDHDSNDLITIDDEFVIDADIIPFNSVNGVNFYLIYDAEYYKDKPIFVVIAGNFIGEYNEHVQLSIEDREDVYNVTITDIDETFFDGKKISNLSVRIYSKITNSTLLWQNLNESLDNESSDIIFYDNDNNSILSNPDNFIIKQCSFENFVFEIYLESIGSKIGIIEKE